MQVLRNRNFLILFTSQLTSTFGNNLYRIALPWFVYALTNSKRDLALVGFANFMPSLAGLFVGVFVDRWRKKRTMVTSDILRTILAVGLFGIAATQGPFWVILMLVLVLEFIGSFFSPASSALTPLLVSKEELPEAMGLNQSGNSLVQLVGMMAGGSLLAVLKAPLLFLTDAVTFVCSVIGLIFVQVAEPTSEKTPRRSYFKEWSAGFRTLTGSKLILLIFSSGLITNFALAPMEITVTAWVKGPLQGTSFEYACTMAALLAGAVIGGLTLRRVTNWMRPKVILQLGLIFLGLAVGLIGAIHNVVWSVSMMFIAGYVVSSLNGSLDVLLVDKVPQSMRGRIFGIFNGVMVLGGPLGIAVLGTVMVYVPLSVTFAIIGALAICGGLIYFVPIPDEKLLNFHENLVENK